MAARATGPRLYQAFLMIRRQDQRLYCQAQPDQPLPARRTVQTGHPVHPWRHHRAHRSRVRYRGRHPCPTASPRRVPTSHASRAREEPTAPRWAVRFPVMFRPPPAAHAKQHMGSSRQAGARLYSFLADAQARGPVEALRALNLEALAGRPIQDIFLGIAEYVCPIGGTVDEGIARDAFVDTIADLADQGISDFDSLTTDQMQTVFEMFAAHAIEARICNDIGKNSIKLPSDVAAVERVQAQLYDFVGRAVSDALSAARAVTGTLTQQQALQHVDAVYEAAFDMLQTLGEAEG